MATGHICPVCQQQVELVRTHSNSGFDTGDQLFVPEEHLLSYPVDGKEEECLGSEVVIEILHADVQAES